MSVIINDFDIVLDKPEQPAREGSSNREQAPSDSQMKPKDVWAIVARQFERCKRVRAH